MGEKKATKHVHRCECKHEKVEYCPMCFTVHCLSCGMEWKPAQTTTWIYPYYPYGGGTYTSTSGITTSSGNDFGNTACSHSVECGQ